MEINIDNAEYSKKVFRLGYIEPDKYGCRQLTKNFEFELDGVKYVIKRGFWWNGASIPQVAWSIVGGPWSDEVYFGALLHDMLYNTQAVSRLKADDVFYKVNEMSGMGWWTNQAMYRSVRAFGGKNFKVTKECIDGCAKKLSIDGQPYTRLIS